MGTTQAFFLGKFLYANSSTPSNFTVFVFHEQESNSSNQHTDFLICHLLQELGQKKSLDKTKALLKQAVHIPSDFIGIGAQLQLFAAVASSIFLGEGSVSTDTLKYLIHILGRNKKSFHDQIALNIFFAAKFLFAIDRRVQRWLRMCKQASVSCTQVNDNILNIDDLIDQVLSRSFQMNFPTSFKKIKNLPCNAPSVKSKQANAWNEGEGNGRNKKKQKSKNKNRNQVKNTAQDEEFTVAEGKTWQETFTKQLPHNHPTWEGKIKMCARWYIKGNCYNNCQRVAIHIMKDKIPADKKAHMLTFMKKCRKAAEEQLTHWVGA